MKTEKETDVYYTPNSIAGNVSSFLALLIGQVQIIKTMCLKPSQSVTLTRWRVLLSKVHSLIFKLQGGVFGKQGDHVDARLPWIRRHETSHPVRGSNSPQQDGK